MEEERAIKAQRNKGREKRSNVKAIFRMKNK